MSLDMTNKRKFGIVVVAAVAGIAEIIGAVIAVPGGAVVAHRVKTLGLVAVLAGGRLRTALCLDGCCACQAEHGNKQT